MPRYVLPKEPEVVHVSRRHTYKDVFGNDKPPIRYADMDFAEPPQNVIYKMATIKGKVVLRKDELYSKTVFSAEYVLQDFFNVSQRHLADDDVEHERLLLEKCLCDFGVHRLEYGILYPQSSSFQIMIRKATRALKDEPDHQPEKLQKNECWFLEEDDE